MFAWLWVAQHIRLCNHVGNLTNVFNNWQKGWRSIPTVAFLLNRKRTVESNNWNFNMIYQSVRLLTHNWTMNALTIVRSCFIQLWQLTCAPFRYMYLTSGSSATSVSLGSLWSCGTSPASAASGTSPAVSSVSTGGTSAPIYTISASGTSSSISTSCTCVRKMILGININIHVWGAKLNMNREGTLQEWTNEFMLWKAIVKSPCLNPVWSNCCIY